MNQNQQDPVAPDVTTIANLAAQSRFGALNGKAAVKAALALWHAAQAEIAQESRMAKVGHAHYVEPLETLRKPNTWPANFDDFLKFIVRGKDAGEQQARFKGYLKWKIEESPRLHGIKGKPTEADLLDKVPPMLEEYQSTKFNQVVWQFNALAFLHYWKIHKAEVKRMAGKQGAAIKAKSKEILK